MRLGLGISPCLQRPGNNIVGGAAVTPFDFLPVLGRYSSLSGVTDSSGVTAWAPVQGTGTWTNTANKPSYNTSGVPYVAFGSGANRRLIGDATIKNWGLALGTGIAIVGLVYFDAAATSALVQLGRSSPAFQRFDTEYQHSNRTLGVTQRLAPDPATLNFISNNNSLSASAAVQSFGLSYDGVSQVERYWTNNTSRINASTTISGGYTQAAMTNAFLGCGEFDANFSGFRIYDIAFINGPITDAEMQKIHEFYQSLYVGVI